MAFIHDRQTRLEALINPETVLMQPVTAGHWSEALRAYIEEHARRTHSPHARAILDNWTDELGHFVHVTPRDAQTVLRAPVQLKAAE